MKKNKKLIEKRMKTKIEKLSFKCIIGILPFERKKKQKIIMNISFNYIFKENQFIDYSKIVTRVERITKDKEFLLIEDALIYLKKQLDTKYPIKKLKISIKKPDILDNCCVCISN